MNSDEQELYASVQMRFYSQDTDITTRILIADHFIKSPFNGVWKIHPDKEHIPQSGDKEREKK